MTADEITRAAAEHVALIRGTCRNQTTFFRKLRVSEWLVRRDKSVLRLAAELGISESRTHRMIREVRELILTG